VDLILVRHGLTDWNEQGRLMGRSDIELNARGHAQVQAVAEALRGLPVQAVLSSPQRRTQQTAEAIARLHELPVRTEPALAEVWLGRWQGMTWNEIKDDPDVARYLADPTHVCDAVEPGTSVHERVVGLVEGRRSDAAENLVLVSHGDPLRILLAHYLSLPLAAYRRLEVAPASVSVLRFSPAFGVRLVLLNWRPQRAGDQLRMLAPRPAPPQLA
jgi:ribonuclease H / adenosylcobalamin/alpha-ribazole phosphatase